MASFLIPGDSSYPSVGENTFYCYEFSVDAFLTMGREYLTAVVGLAEAVNCDYIVFTDAISFDLEKLVDVVRDNPGQDALFGLFYTLNHNQSIECQWPQSFWIEGAAELAVFGGVSSLGSIDHIVRRETIARYLSIVDQVDIESFFQFLIVECFFKKLPVCLWVKTEESPLNLAESEFSKLGKTLDALGGYLSGKHRIDIVNKNARCAADYYKSNSIVINNEDVSLYAEYMPFRGFYDCPINGQLLLTLFSDGENEQINSMLWQDGFKKLELSIWPLLLEQGDYSEVFEIGGQTGLFCLGAGKISSKLNVYFIADESVSTGFKLNRQINELEGIECRRLAEEVGEGISIYDAASSALTHINCRSLHSYMVVALLEKHEQGITDWVLDEINYKDICAYHKLLVSSGCHAYYLDSDNRKLVKLGDGIPPYENTGTFYYLKKPLR